jgi:predicted lysophospholipase L1 biosynthesis ABC-type transport system permease subunit
MVGGVLNRITTLSGSEVKAATTDHPESRPKASLDVDSRRRACNRRRRDCAQRTNASYRVPDGPSPHLVSVYACDRAFPMPDKLAPAVRQNTMNLRRTQSHTGSSGTIRMEFPFP